MGEERGGETIHGGRGGRLYTGGGETIHWGRGGETIHTERGRRDYTRRSSLRLSGANPDFKGFPSHEITWKQWQAMQINKCVLPFLPENFDFLLSVFYSPSPSPREFLRISYF